VSYKNPSIPVTGIKHRKRHKKAYYTASTNLKVSRSVKQGLAEIAELEGRSLSWVVSEVFKYYFGLKDETEYIGLMGGERRYSKLRRVK